MIFERTQIHPLYTSYSIYFRMAVCGGAVKGIDSYSFLGDRSVSLTVETTARGLLSKTSRK